MLSERATVRVSFARAQPSHPGLKRCSRTSTVAGGCTRYLSVGSLTVVGRQGANAISFAGVLSRGRLLRPGSYMLTATPTDADHHTGAPRSARLTVRAGRG